MFDFKFKKFVSVSYAKIVWFCCLLKFFALLTIGLGLLAYAFATKAPQLGIVFAAIYLVAPVLLLVERMSIEAFVVAFRIYEQLAAINRKTPTPQQTSKTASAQPLQVRIK